MVATTPELSREEKKARLLAAATFFTTNIGFGSLIIFGNDGGPLTGFNDQLTACLIVGVAIALGTLAYYAYKHYTDTTKNKDEEVDLDVAVAPHSPSTVGSLNPGS